MKRIILLSTLILWLVPRQVFSQLPVQEAGPMTLAHTATAFYQTVNAWEAIFQSFRWIEEMTSLEGLGIDYEVSAILGLLDQTYVVLWDIQAVDRAIRDLFALDGAPHSTLALQERLWQIRRYKQEVQTAAHKIQTLPIMVHRTLKDIKVLWDRILGLLGNKQAQQQIQAMLFELNRTQTRTEMSLASYQQAMLTDAAEEVLIEEALQNINAELFADMPRR